MASIDKIYGTKEQHKQLTRFIEINKKEYKEFTLENPRIYECENYLDAHSNNLAITNLPVIGDVWLGLNCNFLFVRERLKEMYNIKADTTNEFRRDMISILRDDVNNEFCTKFKECEDAKNEFIRVRKLIEDLR